MATNNQNIITIKLNVNGVTVLGIGSSQEEAKEHALQQISAMLNLISGATSDNSMPDSRSASPFGTKNEVSDNVIGKLQEYCQARQWELPAYTLEKMHGPSHLPNFSMKCQVHGYSAIGSGTSKKEAKYNAAKAVYSFVTQHAEYRQAGSEIKSKRRPICSSLREDIELTSEWDTEKEKSMCVRSVVQDKIPFQRNPHTLDGTFFPLREDIAVTSEKEKSMYVSSFVQDKIPFQRNSRTLDGSLALPCPESAVYSEQESLILKEQRSIDSKSSLDLANMSDDLTIPSSLVVLDEEEYKKIFFERKTEKEEEKPQSPKPIPLPSVEDVLCAQLSKLLTNTED